MPRKVVASAENFFILGGLKALVKNGKKERKTPFDYESGIYHEGLKGSNVLVPKT